MAQRARLAWSRPWLPFWNRDYLSETFQSSQRVATRTKQRSPVRSVFPDDSINPTILRAICFEKKYTGCKSKMHALDEKASIWPQLFEEKFLSQLYIPYYFAHIICLKCAMQVDDESGCLIWRACCLLNLCLLFVSGCTRLCGGLGADWGFRTGKNRPHQFRRGWQLF